MPRDLTEIRLYHEKCSECNHTSLAPWPFKDRNWASATAFLTSCNISPGPHTMTPTDSAVEVVVCLIIACKSGRPLCTVNASGDAAEVVVFAVIFSPSTSSPGGVDEEVESAFEVVLSEPVTWMPTRTLPLAAGAAGANSPWTVCVYQSCTIGTLVARMMVIFCAISDTRSLSRASRTGSVKPAPEPPAIIKTSP